MPERDRGALASRSIAGHLARGAIGFGLIGSGFALAASHGPAALLLTVPGLVALRGCPTCWLAGLIGSLSAGRLERSCSDGDCVLTRAGTGSSRAGRGGSGSDLRRGGRIPATASGQLARPGSQSSSAEKAASSMRAAGPRSSGST